ncbi:hypothetical protein HYX16_01865 [Candidatus Woesearchaeota archaeon]|nr:hypothetical protein [Candidatus Woesearchaeota archaeon]
MKGEITDRLREIYSKSGEEGIWIREWIPEDRGMYIAAAGSLADVKKMEKELGKEIDIEKLTLPELFHISIPGTGETREEACQNAVNSYKKFKKSLSEHG